MKLVTDIHHVSGHCLKRFSKLSSEVKDQGYDRAN